MTSVSLEKYREAWESKLPKAPELPVKNHVKYAVTPYTGQLTGGYQLNGKSILGNSVIDVFDHGTWRKSERGAKVRIIPKVYVGVRCGCYAEAATIIRCSTVPAANGGRSRKSSSGYLR